MFYIFTIVTPLLKGNRYKIKERMQNGERPRLPHNCPKSLKSLIKGCWCLKRFERPTFQVICLRLHHIKGKLIKSDSTIVNNVVKSGYNIRHIQEKTKQMQPTIDTMEHVHEASKKKVENKLVGIEKIIFKGCTLH